MKLRQPWLIKLVAFLAYVVIRLWMATLRTRIYCRVHGFQWVRPRRGRRFLISFWHEDMLVPAGFMGPGYRILISRHADGELIAEVCRFTRAGTVRGSTTRGGVEATRQMLRASRHDHIVVVPDGPRGPRRHLKPGLLYLAARTGLSIIAVGIAYRRAWRMPTWDRFVLPWPGTDARIVLLDTVDVPATISKDDTERYREAVEERMHEAARLAEHWLQTRRLPSGLGEGGDPARIDEVRRRLAG